MPMSPRRRNETILLAILSIGSVVPLRFSVEAREWFLAEMGMLVALLSVLAMSRFHVGEPLRGTRTPQRSRGARLGETDLRGQILALLLFVTPILFAVFARWFGSPIAFEMSVLTAFGSASLSIATIGHQRADSSDVAGDVRVSGSVFDFDF